MGAQGTIPTIVASGEACFRAGRWGESPRVREGPPLWSAAGSNVPPIAVYGYDVTISLTGD
jgi:hypothetical protein